MINHIESIIKSVVQLPNPNSKGWHPILCKVCNDKGRKGPRAAFIFSDGGCSYNCFNCGIAASYHPKDVEFSKDMLKIFKAYGIPDVDIQSALYYGKQTNQQLTTKISHIYPTTIPLPMDFYPLVDDPEDDWCQYTIEYLSNRNIDWTTYPFYCVKPTANKKWYGRLIIPTFYEDNLIFYQGRDLTDMHVKKYLNPPVVRDCILYGYHNLLNNISDPIYVLEGWFDAFQINGVAIYGNKMTAQQIQWLNKTNRIKVIIPDRFGDGHILANQAIQLGWSVSTPFVDTDVKDVNEGIVRYGLLYVMRSIVDNISEGTQAQIRINLYCKRENTHG